VWAPIYIWYSSAARRSIKRPPLWVAPIFAAQTCGEITGQTVEPWYIFLCVSVFGFDNHTAIFRLLSTRWYWCAWRQNRVEQTRSTMVCPNIAPFCRWISVRHDELQRLNNLPRQQGLYLYERSCGQITYTMYSVSQKNPPLRDLTFFHFVTNGSEFLIDFLHTYYTFVYIH